MKISSIEKNESICIGNEIQIIIKRIGRSGKIELGIKAPEKIPIHREEFLSRLKKLKKHLDNLK